MEFLIISLIIGGLIYFINSEVKKEFKKLNLKLDYAINQWALELASKEVELRDGRLELMKDQYTYGNYVLKDDPEGIMYLDIRNKVYLEAKEMVEGEKYEGQCVWYQSYLMTDRCKTKLDILGREYGRPPIKE